MGEKFLYNQILKKETNYNVWMAFPGKYSFSLSSLGYMWIFKALDESEYFNVERITSETTVTKFLPNQINAIGFSFSFDFSFLDIFSILDKYKIPLKSDERDENFPFIFVGGPVVTANPMPYSKIFDFFIIGDGEDVNIQALKVCKENNNKSKNEILKLLSEIEGVYVPKYHKNTIKRTKKLKDCIYTPIISEEAFFKNTFIIEMARGCTNRCGFCLASYLNLPLRSVPENELIKAINLGLQHTNKIAFLGAEVSAHPKFLEVCDFIRKEIESGKNIEMNFSSLRVDAIKDEVIKTLVMSGQNNITLAIEAGSERLRKAINKNLSQEQIFNAIEIAKNNGLKGIKFYGMLGLPSETQDDINELINLTKKIKSTYKNFDISFGFSTFVPKAHTPFQWIGRENSKTLEKKSNYIQKEMHKIGVQTNISSIKWDYWQTVLSRGDESLTEFLIEAYKQGGKLGAFKSSAKNNNIDTDYYAYENIPFETTLPWDFIEIKPGKEFLTEENKRLIT